MRTIPLSKGYVTVVDDEDYERLSRYSWCISLSAGRPPYAVRTSSPSERASGAPRMVYMHREILGFVGPRGVPGVVDHRNHDSLDNRRSNLRACAQFQNLGNQRKTRGSSRYKGVSWDKRRRKWIAQISLGRKRVNLGRFDEETAAARTYDEAAIRQFGEYAHLNFPPGT